ncbi:ATP-binding protein [Brevibacillus parabrevis]|uniref:ATP-binding protein n=1 Tax=Brevibacillus parabrevis TaxID=54914 RepID=UPI00310128E5
MVKFDNNRRIYFFDKGGKQNMNKIEWLRQMVVDRPEDAQAHYWLGVEYATNGLNVDAIGAFSAGLACCGGDDELRKKLLLELSQVTTQLQTASASVVLNEGMEPKERQQAPKASNDGAHQDEQCAIESCQVEKEHNMEEPENKWEDEKNDQASSDVRYYAAKALPGLKLLDGGQEEQRVASPGLSTITFQDVAGLNDLKKVIQLRIISPFFNQGLFSKFRKRIGGGVLLYGPPGCGKTFMARATAGECKATFLPVHITDVIDPYIGVSEQNLKALFEKARAHKPSIMFFDEIDMVGYNRSKASTDTMRGIVDTLLTEMEGIDTSTDQVLILGATNLPWDVDNALKRPGRFDRMIFVAPPDMEARKLTFEIKLQGRYSSKIDVERLAKATEFYSGADIENVVERATEHVLENILETGVERPIQMRDMEQALSEIRPTTLEWLRTAKNYVKYSNQSGIYNEVEDYLRQFGRLI